MKSGGGFQFGETRGVTQIHSRSIGIDVVAEWPLYSNIVEGKVCISVYEAMAAPLAIDCTAYALFLLSETRNDYLQSAWI